MFLELAKKRRSIRRYTDKEITREDLDRILTIATMAPTAKNRDVVEYVLIENPDTLKELSQYKTKGVEFLADAKVAIAVVVNREVATNTFHQDACIAATFLQLAAADLNIGSCWGNVIDATNKWGEASQEVIKRLLHIPKAYHVECVIGLGHPAEEKSTKQGKDLSTHVHKETFHD